MANTSKLQRVDHWEVGDLDIEVKWSCPAQEGCPGGDGCVLEGVMMTAEELLQRYAAGERDFSGVDLSGEDLSEEDLSDIILCDADLTNINLSFSILQRSDFRNSDLSDSNLSGSNLMFCRLEDVLMRNANLRGANWQYSERYGVIFQNTIMPDGEVFTDPIRYKRGTT
jgi:uncharacterized protein YjbI with pentapeptide repeats